MTASTTSFFVEMNNDSSTTPTTLDQVQQLTAPNDHDVGNFARMVANATSAIEGRESQMQKTMLELRELESSTGPMNAAQLLRFQAEITQITTVYETVGKAVSKVTQDLDQLLHLQ